jgi:hypothetical protein
MAVGRSNNGFAAWLKLGADYESYPGIIHGGIIAVILDEILGQAVYRSLGVSGFTIGLRLRYGYPMESGADYVAYAEVVTSDGLSAKTSGRIELPTGELVAAADGTFHLLSHGVLDGSQRRLPPALTHALSGSYPSLRRGDLIHDGCSHANSSEYQQEHGDTGV